MARWPGDSSEWAKVVAVAGVPAVCHFGHVRGRGRGLDSCARSRFPLQLHSTQLQPRPSRQRTTTSPAIMWHNDIAIELGRGRVPFWPPPPLPFVWLMFASVFVCLFIVGGRDGWGWS